MDKAHIGAAWKALLQYVNKNRFLLLDPHTSAPSKAQYTVSIMDELVLDYSNQRIDEMGLTLLFALAKECDLKKNIDALLNGEIVNSTENKPALHSALRIFDKNHAIFVNSKDISKEIFVVREKMFTIADQIRRGEWLGFSGKKITDIVNIGIGGSHLGPQFCINALPFFITTELKFHFISTIDPQEFDKVVSLLNPETTLFIISSKSFNTQETLINAQKAKNWLNQPAHLDKHFIAVTSNIEKARSFEFNTALPIWDWVGGRYSFCSAINLIGCIALGVENFSNVLKGAHLVDVHFRQAEFMENIPVLMALLGIWNNNFLQIHNLLLLTYAENLQFFLPYIQQLDMESNGKSIDKNGCAVTYATGPIIWGGSGNHAQHSYYQLLSQGTHRVAIDLVSTGESDYKLLNLIGNAHKAVLSKGFRSEDDPYGFVPGNIPINHLQLKAITPKTIGMLVALYEHKIFTQSVIWNINPFDQPGVESSKKLMSEESEYSFETSFL